MGTIVVVVQRLKQWYLFKGLRPPTLSESRGVESLRIVLKNKRRHQKQVLAAVCNNAAPALQTLDYPNKRKEKANYSSDESTNNN
jgi:hypothetical protein